MLTTSQNLWAASHDWYVSCENGKLKVKDCYTQNGKYVENVIEWNKSFAELRNWAGY